MSPSEPHLVVHGGVHKTATSHIQSILQRNAGRLRKGGVHYVHHRDTRKNFTYPCQLNGYESLGLNYRRKVPDAALRAQTRGFFDAMGAAPGARIILSDENMAGHCGQCVSAGALYHRRDTLIPIFAREIPHPVREVHLGLRNYADFFASAYVEFLRSASGDNIVTEAQMKQRVLSNLPSWTGLVEVVRDAFPGARLILWRHEAFGALAPRILQNLCGPGFDAARLEAPKRGRGRPSASHRAVQELLAEIGRVGGTAALEQRVAIQERFPRGDRYPAYDPWTKEERAHLLRTYARDIDVVASMEEVEMLEVSHA